MKTGSPRFTTWLTGSSDGLSLVQGLGWLGWAGLGWVGLGWAGLSLRERGNPFCLYIVEDGGAGLVILVIFRDFLEALGC